MEGALPLRKSNLPLLHGCSKGRLLFLNGMYVQMKESVALNSTGSFTLFNLQPGCVDAAVDLRTLHIADLKVYLG